MNKQFNEFDLPFLDEEKISADSTDSPDGCNIRESADTTNMCDKCPGCLSYCRFDLLPLGYGFYRLTDDMVHEINELEAEIVRNRQALAIFLPDGYIDYVRYDIIGLLSKPFAGEYEEYDWYVKHFYKGIDPLDNEEKAAFMNRLREGADETSYTKLWGV